MTADEAAALYRLMTWLSPAFPVGAFSYSSGIEWAVEAGDIADAASLQRLAGCRCSPTAPAFATACFSPMRTAPPPRATMQRLREVAELAAAFVPSRERQLETSSQGRAFIEIARSAWNCDGLERMIAACDGAIVYPVAVGIVSAAHDIPLAPTLHAFLHALASNWISAGARLVPLGQTDSQRVLALLEPVVVATAARALASDARRSRRRRLSRRSRLACGTRRSTRGCSGHEHVGPAQPPSWCRRRRRGTAGQLDHDDRKEPLTCRNLTARFASASAVPSAPARPR